MKKILISGLVMFLIGSAGFGLLSRSLKKDDFKNLQIYFNSYSNLKEEDAVDFSFDEKFPFADVQGLKLNVIFGEIEISESQDENLHVVLSSRIHKDLMPIDTKKLIYQEGSQVHINLLDLFNDKQGSYNLIKVNNQGVLISNVLKLKIFMPQFYKTLRIDTVSAYYQIKNLDLKQLEINNVSGDLKLDQVKVSNAKINTVSGDLEFNDLEFENVKLRSVSGDVQFKLKQPEDLLVQLESISGDFKGDEYFQQYILEKSLKLGEPKKKMTLNSVSGDIEFLKQ